MDPSPPRHPFRLARDVAINVVANLIATAIVAAGASMLDPARRDVVLGGAAVALIVTSMLTFVVFKLLPGEHRWLMVAGWLAFAQIGAAWLIGAASGVAYDPVLPRWVWAAVGLSTLATGAYQAALAYRSVKSG